MTQKTLFVNSNNQFELLIKEKNIELTNKAYNKGTLYNMAKEGTFPSGPVLEEFINNILALDKFRIIGKSNAGRQLVSDNTTVNISYNDWDKVLTCNRDDFDKSPTMISIDVMSIDIDVVNKVEQLFDKIVEDNKKKDNYINIISNDGMGLCIDPFGDVKESLERTNYSKEVLEGFDYIVNDLSVARPTGRLVILEGPPGTGKTYMIRGIVDAAKNCIFMYIPAKTVVELDGPTMIKLLKQLKLESEKKAVVLIVEDADQCLVKREDNDLSSISTFLNLCDGLIGTLLDLRIIASTNAKSIDFEQALLRPGRLSRRVEVGTLSIEEANKALGRLYNMDQHELKLSGLSTMQPITLSEVYAKVAKANQGKVDKLKTNKIGF